MSHWFPKDFTESRAHFLKNTKELGFEIQTWQHPEKGPKGEDLFIDIAVGGDLSSKQAIIHMIGTHGVEAYAGSGIQEKLFDELKRMESIPVKLMFIHPVNPYGMAWLRRTNHSNVDLNRNYRSKNFVTPDTTVYNDLDCFLNPVAESPLQWLSLGKAILKHGKSAIINGVAQGQYSYPKGLFYGGSKNEPEIVFLKSVFEKFCLGLEKIWAFEVHTGLGKFSIDMLIVDAQDGKGAHQEIEQVLNDALTVSGASDSSYGMYGQLSDALRESTQAKIYYVLQEFGTYPMLPNLLKARSENRFHQYSDRPHDLSAKEKQQFFKNFFPEEESWRSQILQRGKDRYLRAFESLLNAR